MRLAEAEVLSAAGWMVVRALIRLGLMELLLLTHSLRSPNVHYPQVGVIHDRFCCLLVAGTERRDVVGVGGEYILWERMLGHTIPFFRGQRFMQSG